MPLHRPHIPLLLSLVLASGTGLRAQASPTWTLDRPLPACQKPVPLGRPLEAGPFLVTARLALFTLDGTAASVRLSEHANFGFDGRNHQLFIEGPAVGNRVVSLGASAKTLAPARLFDLKIERDEDGLVAISIDGKSIHTFLLPGPLGQVTLRPHRNTIRLEAATVTGTFVTRPSGAAQDCPVAPVLLGIPTIVNTVTLRTDTPVTLTGAVIDFRATTDPRDVMSVNLKLRDSRESRILARPSPDDLLEDRDVVRPVKPLSLPAGEHHLQFEVTLAGNASLDHRLGLSIRRLKLENETLLVDGAATPILRFARSLHREGENDCHTLRIPGIARTNDGTLLAVHDMRYESRRDLQGPMDIGLSRSTDRGQTWAPPRPIMDMGTWGERPERENGCSDPNILVDTHTGQVFVSALWTHGKPNTHQWKGKGSEPGFEIGVTTQFMMVRSNDDGLTWSAPENWTRRLKREPWWLFAPSPGNGITLTDGTLVMPTQGRDEKGHPFSNLMFSRDHGASWTVSTAARTNTTESAVAELSDGRLLLSMRDNRNRSDKSETNGRAVSVTADLGATWKRHPSDHGALPEPVCMGSLLRHVLPEGRTVLVFSNPRDRAARRNMTVQFSLDDGLTWPKEYRILLDAVGGAYSSLVSLDPKTIGILYESSRADLVFQRVAVPEALVK